ncbi:hypothetical protein HDU89_006847 [Geranomyces variabilis]|nr:hypothetical protein HDU89_006847 [Geranomyces variabilis]
MRARLSNVRTALFLLAIGRTSSVRAAWADWTISRTGPTDGTIFALNPFASLYVPLTGASVVSAVLSPNVWYKLTSQGQYWTGAEESDIICFYHTPSTTALGEQHCNGRSANTYGVFSTSLGLTCAYSARQPIFFWTGGSTCQKYSDSIDNLYWTYIMTTSTGMTLDFYLADSAFSDNAVSTTWDSHTIQRTGMYVRIYEGIRPVTTISTTTATATTTLRSTATISLTVTSTYTSAPVTQMGTPAPVTNTMTTTVTFSPPVVISTRTATQTQPASTVLMTSTATITTTTLIEKTRSFSVYAVAGGWGKELSLVTPLTPSPVLTAANPGAGGVVI